jgi:hypothetical protein
MPKTLRASLLCFVVLGVAGCPAPSQQDGGAGGGTGGGTSTGGGTAGGTAAGGGAGGGGIAASTPLGEICAALVKADCDFRTRCGAYASPIPCGSYYPDTDPCAQLQVAGVDAGRVAYDGFKGAQCVAKVTTQDCETVVDIPACDSMFTGLVPLNGSCIDRGDCAGDAFCRTPVGVCGGHCVPRIAVGMSATDDDECVEGAHPYDGTCLTDVPHGGACGFLDGGTDQRSCAGPDACRDFTLADGGIVSRCAVGALTGGPCADLDAGINGCSFFAFCDSANTCRARLDRDAGCDPNGYACKYDLWCSTAVSPPSCQPGSLLDEPCSFFTCLSGYCDGVGTAPDGGIALGTCRPLPGLDAGCPLGACDVGLYCDPSYVCQPLKPNGAACTSFTECRSYDCETWDGGASICGICFPS